MAKPTVAQLKQMVEELLTLQALADRYDQIKKQVKKDMLALKKMEIDIPAKGRVFLTPSEKTTYPVELAERVLSADLAGQVIEVKRSVSNKILAAFIQAGAISEAEAEELEAGAEKTPTANLYIRPLK